MITEVRGASDTIGNGEEMKAIGQLSTAFWLVGLGYLGFYVFGVVMGVFSPLELYGFSIVAAVIAVLFTGRTIRAGRTDKEVPGPEQDEMMRRLHDLRERRGF